MNFIKSLKNTKINGCKFLLKEIEYKYINDKIYENLQNKLSLRNSVKRALKEFNLKSEVKYFSEKHIITFANNFINEEVARNKKSLKRPNGGFNLSNSEVLKDTIDVSVTIEINPMDSSGNEQVHYVCVDKGGKSYRIPCASKEQAQMIYRNYNLNSF